MEGLQPDDPGNRIDPDYIIDDGEPPEVKRRLLLAREGKWWWPRWWKTRRQLNKLQDQEWTASPSSSTAGAPRPPFCY